MPPAAPPPPLSTEQEPPDAELPNAGDFQELQVAATETGANHAAVRTEGGALPPLPAPAGPPEPGTDQATAAIPISFDDLDLKLKPDAVFYYEQLTERASELEGKQVVIRGFMDDPGKFKGVTQFMLLREKECPFGPGGQADHVIDVRMEGGATAKYTSEPVAVTGVLRVRPYRGFDGNTWSVFLIEGRRVQ